MAHFRDSRPGLFLLDRDYGRDFWLTSGAAFQRFAGSYGFAVGDLWRDSASTTEALDRARLDWRVRELPLHVSFGRHLDGSPLTGWRGLARPDRPDVMAVETSYYSVADNRDLLSAALEHCERVAPSYPVAVVSYGHRGEQIFFALRIELPDEPLFLLIRNSHGGSGAVRFRFVHLDPSGAVVLYAEPEATHAIPHVGKMREEKLPTFARHSPALRRYVEDAIPRIDQAKTLYWSPQRSRGIVDTLWPPPPPYDDAPVGDMTISPVDRNAKARTTRAHVRALLDSAQSADEAFRVLCRYIDFDSDAADKGDMTPDRGQRLTHGAGSMIKTRAWEWIRRNT